MLEQLHKLNQEHSPGMLDKLRHDAIKNKNVFESLMECCRSTHRSDNKYPLSRQRCRTENM